MAAPVHISIERQGKVVELRLARPKANIVDRDMIAALESGISEAASGRNAKAIVLAAEGPHFSYGASVEEHLPAKCADMLRTLHGLILEMLDCPLPIIAVVQGQCLGGGLEVVMASDLIFAAPDAKFGQPEVSLGLIAPAASCLLPAIIGPVQAKDLLLSGRSIDAERAQRIGLVFEVAADPKEAALAYIDAHLAAKSGAALRFACKAARLGMTEGIRERLARIENLYLNDVMATHDAIEGLNAFLEKRPAIWGNH